MTELNEAKQALDWIKGEVSFIDSYFTGDFATWYNTICKARKRSKVIKEKCNIIIECMNRMEAEYEKKWDLQERLRDTVELMSKPEEECKKILDYLHEEKYV